MAIKHIIPGTVGPIIFVTLSGKKNNSDLTPAMDVISGYLASIFHWIIIMMT